jgi:hypothetical protein
MNSPDPLAVLHSLPEDQQLGIREWMIECCVREEELSMPLLRVLGGAITVFDPGVRRVLASMIVQELGRPLCCDLDAIDDSVTIH